MPRTAPDNPDVDSAALFEIGRRWAVAPAPDLSAGACQRPEFSHVSMFPKTTVQVRAARNVCDACPLACFTACREWALTQPMFLTGMFGGLTQSERRATRKRSKTEQVVAA